MAVVRLLVNASRVLLVKVFILLRRLVQYNWPTLVPRSSVLQIVLNGRAFTWVGVAVFICLETIQNAWKKTG